MNTVTEKSALIIPDATPEAARYPSPTVAPDASALMKIIDRAAMDPSFDVAKLEQLLAVKERWEATEAKKAYLAAMAAFKADPPAVYKDKENKQYNSRYTSIGNLVNTVSAALGPHGLSARWDIDQGDKIRVTCILTHCLGHSESCAMSGPPDTSGAKNPLQQIKSTLTYLKIATFEAITGLASSEGNADDDGNGSGDGNGKKMDAETRALHCKALDEAPDIETLKDFYKTAYRAALGDTEAIKEFEAKKDARKKALAAKS